MQLHEFVDAVTADEPPLSSSVDDIVAQGRKAERRRRAGFASAGAAGLVAVAVAGTFVLSSTGAKQATTPTAEKTGQVSAGGAQAEATWTDAAPFTFTFEGFDAGKLHVQDPIVASTAYQIASIYEDGRTTNDKPVSAAEAQKKFDDIKNKKGKADPTLYAYLTLYKSGAFNPGSIKGGKTGTVDGHQTIEANLPVGLDPTHATDPRNKAFAWEYADNAWAVVTSVSSDEADPAFDDFSALVKGLKPAATAKPAPLPFTVGYVPAGFTPLQTGTTAMPGLNGIAAAREGDFGGATYVSQAPATTGLTGPYDQADGTVKNSFDIFVTPSGNSNQKSQAGKTKCYSGGFCNVWSKDGKVQVQVSDEGSGANLSSTELTKIAQSIKVADVNDQGTWFPATTALKK